MSWELNVSKRATDDYTMRYTAIRPVISHDDFDQAAYFTDSLGGKRLPIDMFITSVQTNLAEHIQTESHIGDTLYVAAYGKSPAKANVSGVLVDARGFGGRAELMALYRDKLRVSSAASAGSMPALVLPNMVIVGPVEKMSLRASSENHGLFQVSMSMLILKVIAQGNTEAGRRQVTFDYTAGEKAQPWWRDFSDRLSDTDDVLRPLRAWASETDTGSQKVTQGVVPAKITPISEAPVPNNVYAADDSSNTKTVSGSSAKAYVIGAVHDAANAAQRKIAALKQAAYSSKLHNLNNSSNTPQVSSQQVTTNGD